MPLAEFAISNTRARARSKDKNLYGDINELLSFFSKKAPYHRAHKLYQKDRQAIRKGTRVGQPRGWNGMVHLFDSKDSGFPSGLLPRVIKHLEGLDYECDVYDNRTVPDKHPNLIGARFRTEKVDSREWQDGAFDAYKANVRGVFEAATGTGKTTLVARMVADLQQPLLILVHTSTLANQMINRIRDLVEFPNAENPIGRIGDGVWEPGLITVATYQTLYETYDADPDGMENWLDQFHALFIDEAHHAQARTYYALTRATAGCYYRYGFSATPFKKDIETELRLVGVCGEIIFSYMAKQAIADGIILPPRIYMLDAEFPELKPVDPESGKFIGKFGDEYKAGLVEHMERNHLLANLANICAEQGLPTIVTVRQNLQGNRLRQLIDDSEYINGSSSTEERERQKKKLASGKLPVLIGSTILNEGEDIPSVGAVVLGGGYRAEHLAIQIVGRGLRPSPGMTFVLVFDIWDSHSYRLEKHSKERFKAWRDAGFDVQVVSLSELESLMERPGFFHDVPNPAGRRSK